MLEIIILARVIKDFMKMQSIYTLIEQSPDVDTLIEHFWLIMNCQFYIFILIYRE